MKILVTGGTGTVGSQVVNELVKRGASVSVLTRDPKKTELPDGVAAVQGDLAEPASVRRVFKGFEGVFLLNPVAKTEAYEGLMGVAGMRLAGVKRVVYMSVHDLEGASYLPHFGSKVGVEHAVRTSGIPYTIVRPNNFYQNDYWFKDALQQFGVYPQPLGNTGLSRVDVRDIAEAAAIAFTASGHDGQVYDLVGPDVVTGEDTARIWGEALGRTIAYGGNDLDVWEQQFLQYMPDWMVFDFRLMYDHFQRNGLKATPEALERLEKLLGHAPRPFDAFAKETAAAWQASTS
ncbi:MAG: NmrA family NAD(P)-binding protein [Acidobacteria bacterium]|nr:NmrA family NAD(P)-binding protein [Acidobacteriota bacterium]